MDFIFGLLSWVVGIVLLGVVLFRIFRIIRPFETGLVERLGKYNRQATPGLNIVLPGLERIIIVDSQRAGEGASSRNSGYLVDTTLNDGFTTNKELSTYKIKTDIYDLGIKFVKRFIKNYQVDCDWNECGKFFASSRIIDINTLEKFSESLSKLGFNNNLLLNHDLKQLLGTEFYKVGLHTTGGILLHPGKLARAMVDVLPENVELYENSTLINWKKNKDHIICDFANSNIKTKKIIFCTNGFFKSIGIKKIIIFH